MGLESTSNDPWTMGQSRILLKLKKKSHSKSEKNVNKLKGKTCSR
jgi:hypothetical protein